VSNSGRCKIIPQTRNILSDVFSENAFYFYVDVGIYADRCAVNLADFYDILVDVDIRSIEFHMSRGDFEK
jgi:hypothetical protein